MFVGKEMSMVSHGISSRASCPILWLALICACVALPLQALPRRSRPQVTSLTILVTDAASHKPIFQARLTLSFRDPDSRIGSSVSYSAKTDMKGKYTFSFIPMEPVLVVVTAPEHQTFGQKFDVTQENQTIQVKLNPPQPLR